MLQGDDYYSLLGVNCNATSDEIKRAYKQSAKKYHPDRNINNCCSTETIFKKLTTAYEILRDPESRNLYDKFGETGASYHSDIKSEFENFFDDFPCPFTMDKKPQFFWSNASRKRNAEYPGCFSSKSFQRRKIPIQQTRSENFTRKQNEPKFVSIPLELKELCLGCTSKQKISRKLFDNDSGNVIVIYEELFVTVDPGTFSKTQITIPSKGDEAEGKLAGDLVFVVEEIPHSLFQRNGDDLVAIVELSLKEALCGTTKTIFNLFDEPLVVEIPPLMPFEHQFRIPEEGMTIRNEHTRGDLILKFRVLFPESLTLQQREILDDILP